MKWLQVMKQTELCPIQLIGMSVSPCQRHLGIWPWALFTMVALVPTQKHDVVTSLGAPNLCETVFQILKPSLEDKSHSSKSRFWRNKDGDKITMNLNLGPRRHNLKNSRTLPNTSGLIGISYHHKRLHPDSERLMFAPCSVFMKNV